MAKDVAPDVQYQDRKIDPEPGVSDDHVGPAGGSPAIALSSEDITDDPEAFTAFTV